MESKYSMLIQWSDEDKTFLVTIPEFRYRVMMPCTEGKTYEEAARSGQEIIETFLEIWAQDGNFANPTPELFVGETL